MVYRNEHRTDGTDAFDTLYIGCEKFPYRDAFSINVSGVIWFISILLGDALNDFALASAVLRAVPYGHSRKSLHRRAIVNGATVSAIRLLSLSHGKKIAYLRLNKIAVLDFCPPLILSLQLKFCKEMLKNIRCSYTLYRKIFVTLQTNMDFICKWPQNKINDIRREPKDIFWNT